MVKRVLSIFKKNTESEAIYREDSLTKLGREQLRKINDFGLDLPVALL